MRKKEEKLNFKELGFNSQDDMDYALSIIQRKAQLDDTLDPLVKDALQCVKNCWKKLDKYQKITVISSLILDEQIML